MKCKLSSYVVKHSLTTLKYNNISQVCPYKDLGSAKDYIIILLFLMQPSAGDKPDRMQSQRSYYNLLCTNKTLSIENLIDAIVKTCSTEQFDNILTVLIKTQTSCTNKDKVNFVKMNMYISKEVGNETKIQIIKILREQFNTISLSLKEAKDYIDSCIGEYNIFPKVVTQEKINELIRKLEPYNVSINTIKLMQQKYCTYTVRISINFVGLISQERI